MARSLGWKLPCVVLVAIVVSGLTYASERAASTKASAKLASLLRSDNERHQHAALDQLAELKLDNRNILGLLTETVRKAEKTGRLTAAVARMVGALAALNNSAAVDELLSLLASEDSRIVMLSADALAEHKRKGALTPLIQLRNRTEFESSYGFRHCTVDAVARLNEPESVDFLVSLMPEIDGQLKYATTMHLSRLTGQQFGSNAAGWKQWWTENREGFSVQQAPVAVKAGQVVVIPWDHPVPTFYGVPIYARRMVFLIDRSKSMLSTLDGQTRMERAQEELSQTIRNLPGDAYFNVIAFDRAPVSWKTELVPATDANKRDAVSAVRRLIPGEKTAAYEALEQGFSFDPNTELIVFLSDGRPTAGEIIAPEQIVDTISWMNLFRRASIDALALDTEDDSERFMQDLANRNFGQFFRVR